MSTKSRIDWLERELRPSGDAPLEPIPEAWTLPDYDGRPIGPAHGEHVTEGQRRAWETLQAMNEATVPGDG